MENYQSPKQSTYTVVQQAFEGPLDLLLQYIESKKLDISAVSLSLVTQDFLQHLEALRKAAEGQEGGTAVVDIHVLVDFVSVASRLILIKSKSLLPSLALSNEEEDKIVDLEKRLMLYQGVKDISLKIKEIFSKNTLYFKEENTHEEIYFVPDHQCFFWMQRLKKFCIDSASSIKHQ